MRLDKFLKETGFGTRKEVKIIIKQKKVQVNDSIINDDGFNIDENNDIVKVDGNVVSYVKNIYIMLNKPQGVVSATVDNVHQTVIDLINEYKHLNLFPVGRLDIDTVGLLLITNDGELSHNLLSPKKHIDKTYFLTTNQSLTKEDIEIIENGVMIDNELTLPAKLIIVNKENSYYLTIKEGKFHQVKRMIQAVNKKVIFLKRISFGPLTLDENLEIGKYRLLTNEEIELLNKHKK